VGHGKVWFDDISLIEVSDKLDTRRSQESVIETTTEEERIKKRLAQLGYLG
jgi:hypothetical protein